MRDVTSFYQISKDKLLMKLRTDCKNKFYYTMMDTGGRIIEMEAQLRDILSAATDSIMME